MRAGSAASAVIAAACLLCACGRAGDWQTRNITGLMPRLAFELTDDRGERLTAQSLRGKYLFVYYGFTSCPDVCPATLGRLAAVISGLPPAARERVRVLFVSVDPQRDSVERLHQYVGYFGPQFIGLRGDTRALDMLTRRYRVTYAYGTPDPSGEYDVSHSSAVFVFDPEGRPRLILRDQDPVTAISGDLQQLLAEDRDRV